MDFLKKIFSEDNGNPSFMRAGSGLMLFLFIPSIAFALIYSVFSYKELLITLVGMLLASVTATLGIKAYQKKDEA